MPRVQIVEYDPQWPEQFAHVAGRIRSALGDGVISLEHVGSTAVPGLAAKNIIDIVMAVADATDEAAYAPALERAGFRFHRREPHWHEHRLFKDDDPTVHLHVFSAGCGEVDRMRRFRDRLRQSPEDRARYEQVKRELAARWWRRRQDYADAKTPIVTEIEARITKES